MRLETVAAHEAGHLATALLLGLEVQGVEMAPEAGTRASSLIPMSPDTCSLLEVAVVLAGGMAAGEADGTGCEEWPPAWPIASGERGDIRKLYALAHVLRLDEAAYQETVRLTEELIASPEFKRLHRTITAMLGVLDEIPGEELLRIHRAFEEIEEGAIA